ncbi:MAG TPA: hypothetical protein VGO84_15135, partial [Burkholderiales bacterium]|nr:hypothetical protein [Burkholderiales bacterium]
MPQRNATVVGRYLAMCQYIKTACRKACGELFKQHAVLHDPAGECDSTDLGGHEQTTGHLNDRYRKTFVKT